MDNFLKTINSNGFEVGIALLVANMLAQWIKLLINYVKKRQLNFKILFAAGGMPSSHSSTVSAMATSVGLIEGFDSVMFAMAAALAGIVMYDAGGVRQAASKQAKVLNKIIRDIVTEGHTLKTQRLREFLGHTPTQIFAGAGLGIAISLLLRYWIAASV